MDAHMMFLYHTNAYAPQNCCLQIENINYPLILSISYKMFRSHAAVHLIIIFHSKTKYDIVSISLTITFLNDDCLSNVLRVRVLDIPMLQCQINILP